MADEQEDHRNKGEDEEQGGSSPESGEASRILVVQQGESGKPKIEGIRRHGGDRFTLATWTVPRELPRILDETEAYLPDDPDADLVLDFVGHPDVSQDLIALCRERGIPVVAPGKGANLDWAHTPPIWCALRPRRQLGAYGRCFGYPEFEVRMKGGRVSEVRVKRGAPCGATWSAASRVAGQTPEEAAVNMGLAVQYACTADPANWEPLGGQSPVHLAAKVHQTAMRKALLKASDEEEEEED